ncbi:GNAT family N-acetyltransferase [Microbacterium sp. CFH 31415]|uniref:GNAT family N-acetyltransferase n=1 Tax=Microbacterium sp. CFH 31415 TaxID=2921732 RepID=UPI001F130E95|nr:GNAT family N-acetyltransferase [Microbacterium sp. CFH 31415]MCH6231689.1 GNAT family N-acetyltransferase [Microbacterium sp. CFH 31415]
MADVRVRPIAQADIGAVAELKEQWAALPEPVSPEQRRQFAETLARWIERKGASLIARVADHRGELVGMAWLVAFERVPNIDRAVRLTGDIQSVYVAPAFRGAGVGRALVASLLEAADAQGIQRVTVSANHAAAPLYAQLGFRSDEYLLERRRPPSAGRSSP